LTVCEILSWRRWWGRRHCWVDLARRKLFFCIQMGDYLLSITVFLGNHLFSGRKGILNVIQIKTGQKKKRERKIETPQMLAP
jgi:hypothetical protein